MGHSVHVIADYTMEEEAKDREHVDYIITSSFPYDYKRMKSLMEKKKVPYIVEVCEWYGSSGYKLGKLDIRYMINQRTLIKRYTKEDKLIAISRYCSIKRGTRDF